MADYIVVGGGISGLTAAYYLKKAGKDVLLLEASDRVGGNINTVNLRGFLIEEGPFSLRNENRTVEELLTNLNLTSQVQAPSIQLSKRYLVKDDELYEVSGPVSLLTSSLLTVGGKLAILSEPFQPKGGNTNESVASFFERRTGRESVDYLIDPLMRSTFAGDATNLTMRYALPKLHQLEQEYGSLFNGMRKSRKNADPWKKTLPRIFSFKNGLSTLTEELRKNLGKSILLNTPVLNIRRFNTGFEVNTLNGVHQSRTIIVSTPATSSVSFLSSLGNTQSFSRYPYAGVAVVSLGFKKEDVTHSLAGFGFVAPSIENKKLLGCIFSSSVFEGRTLPDHVLLSVLIGGANGSEYLALPQDQIIDLAYSEVKSLLGIKASPQFSHLKVWKPGIPQYTAHYQEIERSARQLEDANPGLYFLGNYIGGISIGSCIKNATELTKRLVN